MRGRRCYIHIGTHKTGTTSIQHFLGNHEAELAEAGLYYPRAGRPSPDRPAHYNLLNEMSGRKPLVEGAGSIRDMIAELERVQPASACLSAEGFSTLYDRLDALAGLRDALIAIGYVPYIVLYVRAQDQYIESVYKTAVNHGWDMPLSTFVGRIMSDGLVRDEARGWLFDYERLIVEPFRAIFGERNMSVLGYRRDGSADLLVREFLGVVGVPAAIVPADGAQQFHNARWTTAELVRRLFANSQHRAPAVDFSEKAKQFIAEHADVESLRYSLLAPAMREQIAARFAKGNARLVEDWHVPAATFSVEADTEEARRSRLAFFEAESLREKLCAGA